MATSGPAPIISVSGLRGIVGSSLTPDLAMRYVAAFAADLDDGPIVLTRDGRATGPMLCDAIRAALMAMGRDVLDAGIAATPTTGIVVRQTEAAGGIQVSASHNPPEYNGIKLFGPDGRVVDAERGRRIEVRFREELPDWCSFDALGRVVPVADPHLEHLRRVLETVDARRIRSRRFRVLLDSNHGAGSILGLRLLDELGCEVVPLGATPDGAFEHTPEPTAENLAEVAREVAHQGVDVGFCQDPDADRLALIDADGRYVGEEYTLAVTLRHALRSRSGPVVVNCATSRMSQDLADAAGVPCVVSAVGEANVTSVMLRENAVYGGEGNGGPIDPRVGYVRDSFVAMAQVLDAMALEERPLAAIVDDLPRYAIHKTKITLPPDRVADAMARLEQAWPEAKVDRQDGLRLDWAKGWLLLRASNTEPIVRIIAEAETDAEARRRCDAAMQVIAAK